MPLLSDIRALLNTAQPNGDAARLGNQVVDKVVQLAKGTYRFSASGGASTNPNNPLLAKLKDVDGKDLVLPAHALIKQVTVDPVTTPTASAVAGFTAPKISLGVNNQTDLMASTLATSFSAVTAGTPVGTAATMVEVGTGGRSAVGVYLTGGSLLSGSLNVFIEYYLSD